ncbi:MAG: class II fructose-bisphosphate aldolase [Bacteroidetes bacterium]|nr:MAG: class II fructose-bisphosphate aldolase [Bacteroidota bacterium]
MRLQDKLKQLKAERKAILAANFYNFETLSGILLASSLLKMPVILQLSESSIRYMGLTIATAMARAALKEYAVEGWLHLDHGCSVEIVQSCLDEGFDSVMIDASEKSLDENITITRQVVKIAAGYDACVEAELGFVAKLGQEQSKQGFTQCADAKRFTDSTGVHALAVAIGSSHGFYKHAPILDIELLSRISESVPTPLVLHGSSGIPDAMLQEAIRNGICKVNLATETKNTFMLELKERLKNNSEIDLRIVFPDATQAVVNLIVKKMKTIHQA